MRIYYRNIDAGHGRQYVVFEGGIVVDQWLSANSGYYTGDGNPEWIGKKRIGLKRNGFKPLYIPKGQDAWELINE